ncbi:MAG TPA: trypsin-like peptidase domain-containing protein [Acidimicrobiales bacterium]|nr:trypsin-like peptidase domain-containing protein [Acidimicrobiales bacterium]
MVVQTLTRQNWRWVVAATAAIAALVGAVVGLAVGYGAQKTVVERFFPNQSVLSKPTDVQSVLSRVEPAVVSIDTTAFSEATGSSGGQVQGAGTGMILSPTGEVLTNDHVVAGATVVTVTLFGQTRALAAHVIGTDPSQDLALVQIDNASGLPTVQLGDSTTVQVGDDVLAIGNALALAGGPTVTQGIVSAKGRSLSARSEVTGRTEMLNGLLQTDAAINPGNSGGPLVDSRAQVVGMNTAVAESGQGNAPAQAIGFAIAIDSIKPVLAQLASGGSGGAGGGTAPNTAPATSYLGVVVRTVTSSVARQLRLTAKSGAVVVGLAPGGPAAAAGMKVDDVIVSVAGQAVRSVPDLVGALRGHPSGTGVVIETLRGPVLRTVHVTLGSQSP